MVATVGSFLVLGAAIAFAFGIAWPWCVVIMLIGLALVLADEVRS